MNGFTAPLKAFGFILKRPRLWWLALTPFLINLGLFALFFWLGYTSFTDWITTIVPTGDGWWWQALYYVLVVLAAVLLLVVQVYVFTVVGRILAAPFLEALTRKVEDIILGRERDYAEIGVFESMRRLFGQELKKLALYIAAMLLLLLLNIVPGLGSLVYGAAGFFVTAFFLALEFFDYPLERRGLSLAEKIRYVRDAGWRGLAFGSAVFLTGVVPIVNLAFLPLAAVGGTLLYLDGKN